MSTPTRDISTLFRQRVPHFEAATRTPAYVLIQAEYVPDGAKTNGQNVL